MMRRAPTKRECLALIARSRRNIRQTYIMQAGTCLIGALNVQNIIDNGERWEIAFISGVLAGVCVRTFILNADLRAKLRRSMNDLQQAVDEGLV